MKMLLVFLFLLVTPFYPNLVLGRDIGRRDDTLEDDDLDPVAYLERGGYLDDLDSTKNRHHAPDNVKQALREFQDYAGLPVTGRMDGPTYNKMKEPRCGNADVIKPSQRPKQNDPNAPLSYELMGSKWHHNDITYRFNSYTDDMPQDAQREAVTNGLAMWAAVTPLNFSWKNSGHVDIELGFGKRAHGDGYPFDGRGTVLAHAFKPGPRNLDGDLHFDDDETWTSDKNQLGAKVFETVATHELGHTLGLAHSKVESALMYPWYTGEKPALQQDDIDGIQSLYGARPVTASPPVVHTGPPVVYPTQSHNNDRCSLQFDAIAQVGPSKTILVFAGDSIYTMTPQGLSGSQRIDAVYPGAPSSPGAVFYNKWTQKTYIFKDRRFWRYTGFNLDPSYPKVLYFDFQYVDAALMMWWGDQNIYLFKGNQYTTWQENMRAYPAGYPKRISEKWPGAPSYINAAFHVDRNGYIYFFNGQQQYKYSLYTNVFEQSGSAKHIKNYWLGCGTKTSSDEEHLFA